MEKLALEDLKQAYELAEKNYDIEGRAACMLAAFEMVLEDPSLEALDAGKFFSERVKVFLLAALDYLQKGNGRLARYYLSQMDEEVLAGSAWFPCYAFYLAWAYDLLGKEETAKDYLEKYLNAFPKDVLAMQNRRLFQQREQRQWQRSLSLEHAKTAYREIPIFINSRDRLACLQELVCWLVEAGYRYIVILDNASTYAPLLRYYEEIQKLGINVVLLENLGHRAIWESGILDQLDIQGPYVYTDSDVVPGDACPKDFLRKFLEILERYPYLQKVGNGLFYEDVTYFDREATKKIESKHYKIPLEQEVFFADVDTTMALYRNARHYLRGPAARVAGDYRARHLPWYYDYGNLPEDERYYMEHAGNSSSMKELSWKAWKARQENG